MILTALLGAVGNAILAWRKDRQAEAAIRGEAVAQAENAMQQVILETADARSKLRPADDAADLARRLRERAEAYLGSDVDK